MDKVNFPEDSDSSDEDYVPTGPAEVPSEVDSDGDPEDPLSESEDAGKRGTKRKRKTLKAEKKEAPPAGAMTEEEKKKHADALWASFKKDTGFKSKTGGSSSESAQIKSDGANKGSVCGGESSEGSPASGKRRTEEKVKVTQVFEFAGEEVRVEKEVPVGSLLNSKPVGTNIKKKGGLGSVLSQLGKKTKVTTLEKSKMDWDKYKKEEGMEAELRAYNKGKNGYLERQDFLERSDFRRFEIEKEVRTIERNKRLNNT